MNVIIFSGNLVADAEQRFTNDGKAVCGFKVANNQGFGDNQHTEYYQCSLWGKKAEGGLVPLLVKGKKVTIHGEHKTEEREHNGKTYFNNKIYVREVELGSSNGGENRNNSPSVSDRTQDEKPAQQAPQSENQFDEPPF